jgi:hypothetical protein
VCPSRSLSCDATLDRSIVLSTYPSQEAPLECALSLPRIQEVLCLQNWCKREPHHSEDRQYDGSLRKRVHEVSSADHDALPHLWLYRQSFDGKVNSAMAKAKMTNRSPEKRKNVLDATISWFCVRRNALQQALVGFR